MPEIQRINAGARMSDVLVHNGIAYLSGKVPSNLEDNVMAQTQNVLNTIDSLLSQAGTSKDRVLRAEIYLSDIANWAEMNKAWDAWVTPGSAPARATVEAKLAKPEYLVEIVVTAAI